MKRKGISLIVLVITIIVMIILAGAIILTLESNGIIGKANKAKIMTEFAAYKEEFEYNKAQKLLNNDGDNPPYIEKDEIKKAIPSISEKEVNNVAYLNSKLIYIYDNITNKEENIERLGYTLVSRKLYDFNKEILNIESTISEIITQNSLPIGDKIGSDSHPETVNIRGISYGSRWHYLDKNHLSSIEITNAKYAPYLVNYNSGMVISIQGIMDGEVPIHFINQYQEQDEEIELVLDNLVTGVTFDSPRTSTKFGEFEILESLEGDNDVTYENNKYRGLQLSNTSKVGRIIVNQEMQPVGETYSINLTIKGTVNQMGVSEHWESYPATLCALSEELAVYLNWIGIVNGYLHVYSYKTGGALLKVDYEYEEEGFASIAIPEYENKYLNIQVVGTRGEDTKVYLNGRLVKTFNSGIRKIQYKNLILGDLRVGRGLKYTGTVYNFALYSSALSEAEVSQNWEYNRIKLNIKQ